MTEKNQQEKSAAERQAELFSNAFDKAKENGGVWLDTDGRKRPAFYQKAVTISPFNAIVLGMHSDQKGYQTSQYTLFSDAKKRGESVQSKEKGVPFFWYNWNEYVNKRNPEDKISRADYQNLSDEQKNAYKGIRSREVRTLFNIEQTTLPMVDKKAFAEVVKTTGRPQENLDEESENTRMAVNDLIVKTRDNLVDIRPDAAGVARYDSKQDVIFMPKQENYQNYADYVRDAVAQIVTATGHQQRLAREGMVMKGGKAPSEDAMKQEHLVVEVATAAKLQELGISAKLSPESMKMTDYWKREMTENPCLLDAVERDVNNALDMIHKVERGEKVELASTKALRENASARTLLPKHYYVADEIKTLPNKDTKELVVVRDPEARMAEVIMPAGASTAVDNEIPGMNKSRIEHALQKEGYDTVTFYNVDGSLGFRPDDSYFDGKEVSVSKLNKWELDDITKLDVTDAVKRSGAIDFDKVLMLRNDEGKWALFMKPENEKSFCVYPDRADVNLFFTTVKQGDEENTDQMRQDMAQKYYAMAQEKPDMKVDLFKSQATPEDLARIERASIFKTKETEQKPSVILCATTIDGVQQKPREVSEQQWQRMWLADDKRDYKTHLAASLFADVLRQGRTNSVAIGTDKSEQEAQTKNEAQHAEFHEENDKKDQKEEQAHTDYHQQEDKKNAEEQKTKQKQEEAKAKQKESKPVLSPLLKQFLDLKAKHPDALLLFRTGDFYETYKGDAEKASKILGITLTKSTKTKDDEGKPLAMAGFPYHALDTYLPKLIRAGQRVAICDQIEQPKQTLASRSEAPEQKADTPKQEASQGYHR